MRRIAFLVIVLFLAANTAFAIGEDDPILVRKPTEKDKCGVCGMLVHKYPNWLAYIEFGGNEWAYFDGPKDMFYYYLDLPKYTKKTLDDFRDVYVTDYYTLKTVRAEQAYFVIGSDVQGPMGKELVPFSTEAAAREFMKDHKGRKIVRFGEVTMELLKGL